MRIEKIDVKGVPETMLQTLYARAKESLKENHCIYDEKAVEMVSQLDYDFSLADKDTAMSSGVIARTILLDKMVEEFLESHEDTTVVNLACGLDTRCYRMEGKYKNWYNLDLPETMNIRKRFLKETDRIHQIAGSAMDKRWTDAVEPAGKNVLIIIEGLTMYLSRKDVQSIFKAAVELKGEVTIFVETMSPWIVKHFKEKSIEGSAAKFTWGVKNGRELQKIIPGYVSVKDHSLVEGMAVFLPIYRVLGKIGFVRNISNKILIMKKSM